MIDQEENDYFRDFGDGLFRAVEFWVLEKDGIETLRAATAVMEWTGISFVQAWPEPSPFSEATTPQGPKCLVYYQGREMKLLAPFTQLAKAWQKYRSEKKKRKQNTYFPHIGKN